MQIVLHAPCRFVDIDQGFSVISSKLRKTAAKTLPELLTVIQTAKETGMITHLLPKVFNFRDWIEPYLGDLHNQSFPHSFRYVSNAFTWSLLLTVLGTY